MIPEQTGPDPEGKKDSQSSQKAKALEEASFDNYDADFDVDVDPYHSKSEPTSSKITTLPLQKKQTPALELVKHNRERASRSIDLARKRLPGETQHEHNNTPGFHIDLSN